MAKSPKNWAIQKIFKVTVKNVLGTVVYGTMEDMKEMSIENAQNNVFSMGGVGNPYLNSFQHSKRVTGTASSATFDNTLVGLITGTAPVTGAKTIGFYEDVFITSDGAVTTKTAVGTAGSEILKLEVYGTDGFPAVLTQDATAAAGKFAYAFATKVLSFFANAYDDGTRVRVYYNITTGADAVTLSNTADGESASVRLEMVTLVKDENEIEFAATLIVYKSKLSGALTLGTAADGEPATLNFNFDSMVKSPSDSKFWDLVVFDMSAVS